MRALLIVQLTLVLVVFDATAGEPELVTVSAEATVDVLDENYYQARERALRKAFRSAAYLAVAGIVPPEELEAKKELIQERIVSKGKDFVSSYKFLDEVIDHARGKLTARLQVTLFLDTIRGKVSVSGVRSKKRQLPKLVIIIKEQSSTFMSGDDLLLFASLSEEIIASNFRQRGFLVADRSDVRKAKLETESLAAINGDPLAAATVGKVLKADMALFGKTTVGTVPMGDGEGVEVVITVSIRKMPGGAMIAQRTQTGHNDDGDMLKASRETIQATARVISQDLALTVASKWRDLKELTDG